MNKLIRILGGLIGIAALVVGVLIITQSGNGSLVRWIGGISLVIVGVYFSNYAISGKTVIFRKG